MIGKLLQYQKITLLFFLMTVVVGYFSFATLNQRENPEMAVSVAIVKTVYPGASPEKVEQLITKPLEERINEMENISILHSTSTVNASIITVELIPGSNNKQSWDMLRQKVQAAESSLPAEAHKPEVNDDLVKIAEQIIHLTVETPAEIEGLRAVADDWKTQLRAVSGVSTVEIVGLPKQEVKVVLDIHKLERYQLPWSDVVQALKNAHDRTPIGEIERDQHNVFLNLTGEWAGAEAIANTIIYRNPGQGMSLKVQDVADVKLSTAKVEERIFNGGKPTIDIVINAEKGIDIPSLQNRIDVKVAELKPQLPQNVKMDSVFSQKESVQNLFSELSRELIIGIIAVIIICSFGLTWGTSLIVALAIPISMAVGFIPANFFGIDLNQITIISLVIVLGILVDDAIVVNDNIERRLQLGNSPQEASLKGSRDVAVSITTATIATGAAFFPLFFLKGNIGDFIRPIPVVISLTLVASMIMSLTIIPIFRQWASLRRNRGKAANVVSKPPGLLGKPLQRLSEFYERQIYKFLRKPLLTGFVALLIGTSSFGLLPLLGVQYFPNAEREEFLVDVKMPMGSTFDSTVDMMQSLSAWAAQKKGVKSVSAYAGTTSPKFYYTETSSTGSRIGQLFVKIDKKVVRTADLVQPWRQELQQLYPGVELIPRELEQGPPVGAPVAVRISGPELSQLQSISQQMQDNLAKIHGAVNISDSIGAEMYTLDLRLDQDKANYYGINDKNLSSTVRLASEGIEATKLQLKNDFINVVVYSGAEANQPMQALEGLLVPALSGKLYPLKDFVTLQANRMISSVDHRNMVRTVTVRSYTEGVLPDEIVKQLKAQNKQLQLPTGYTVEYGGENEERNDAFIAIGKLSIIVILLIYIIIAMQFYSLSIPFLILSTVYLAVGGALIGLYITHSPIGFMALMGILSLSGIVVRNGIVLIEFIEQAREQGLALYDAIAQSGRARLRPILLTTATAIFGLLPMTLLGGNLWRPMAISIISGLIYSTVLTLIVVPSLYLILAKWRDQRKEKQASRGAGRMEDPSALHL